MERKVILDRLQLNNLRNYVAEIGHGSDGRVFKYDKKHFIKLYRKSLTFDYLYSLQTDIEEENLGSKSNDGTKIYVMKKDRKPDDRTDYGDSSLYSHDVINYYKNDTETDTIKLSPREAIEKAIERQDSIKRTKLPVASVYLGDKFVGCVIEKLKGIPIHKLMWLPLNSKKKIINNVIDDLEELMNNYVYHRDLSNSPFAAVSYVNEDGKHIREHGHSHVLVNPLTLNTHIIDLDGKSTIYTERASNQYKEDAIRELLVLILEYLVCITLVDYEMDMESEYNLENPFIQSIMNEYNCEEEFLCNTLFNSIHSLDDVRHLVKIIK